jgi:hypothetical protein
MQRVLKLEPREGAEGDEMRSVNAGWSFNNETLWKLHGHFFWKMVSFILVSPSRLEVLTQRCTKER